jgi:hypothetical protein
MHLLNYYLHKFSNPVVFLLFTASCLTLTHCHPDNGETPVAIPSSDNAYISENGPKISIHLSGLVVDENKQPVSGALIEAYGETTTTNVSGEFSFESISVPQHRCYVKCTKDGYFTASNAQIPNSKEAFVQMVLMSEAATHQIEAGTGGKAILSNGSSVEIPANSIVTTNGSSYNGEVQVTLRHLDPSGETFAALVPGGDFAAQRSDETGSILYSYGILRVLLRDQDGNNLQLADGKEAILSVAISDEQLADAPNTIPLWYFDEDKGLWREEGEATRQGNRYIGKVKHFTDWNCDVPGVGTEVEWIIETEGSGAGEVIRTPVDPENPGDPITTEGIPCTGAPMRYTLVKIGQSWSITDENGAIRRRVPNNRQFPVLLYQGPGLVMKVADVGPYQAGQKPEKRTFKVPCPVFVVGRTLCNGTPYQADFILNTDQILSYGKRPTDEKGVFRVTVAPGYESTISISDPSTGKMRDITFKAPNEDGVTLELGNIEICRDPQVKIGDNTVTLNGDGYINQVINLKEVVQEKDQDFYGFCQNSAENYSTAYLGDEATDDISLELQWPGCAVGEYKGFCGLVNGTYTCRPLINLRTVKDGQRYTYYTAYGPNRDEKIKNTKITITKYTDAMIEGTFSGIVTRLDSKTNQWIDVEIKEAKFSVRRTQ